MAKAFKNQGLKKIIMMIREKIYFKDIHQNRKYGSIILTGTTFTVKDDLTTYHEYYMNHKKLLNLSSHNNIYKNNI